MATKPEELASREERGITSPPSSSVHARPGLPGAPSSAPVPVPGPPAAVGAAASPAPSREREAYSHLIDDYTHFSTLHQGEIRQGRVVKISGDGVIVDIGYKNEGLVPLEQFRDAFGEIKVQPGDMIDVMLDNAAEMEGYIRLSHERAKRLKLWEQLEKAFAEKLPTMAQVVNRVKGGLEVDLGGVRAFMPGSQADLRPTHNLDAWKGREVEVRILRLNRKRGNIVVSRRTAIEEEINERRGKTLGELREGAVVTGTIKNLTEYGAFVDLGGVDGLLHVTDISYSRVAHPSEALHVGDEVTVKVLKFDREKQRVSLGMKQLHPDPWETVTERYPVNCRAYGRVMNVTDYGAFVELETGVEGLIHVTEMTWSKRTKHPSKVVKTGDQVEVVVLEVQPKDRRISLGLKQLEPNPWTTLADRYSVGSVVEGRVRNITDFGAFVEIEEGIDGLVHVSDISWTKHVKHPSEVLKKGQRVQVAILRIDAENRRLSLGMKQLQPDAWEVFFHNHAIGDTIQGKVTRHAGFGLFIEVAAGVEALCHNSEIPSGETLADGQEASFKIIKLNPAERRIGLSVRALAEEEDQGSLEQYKGEAAAAAGTTIEEVLSLKQREEK